jgi:hypothetical protein
MAADADEASGVAISTHRRPPPIELSFGGRVLHIISKHAVKSVLAYLQYSADEDPRACCSVREARKVGISQGRCKTPRPTQEVTRAVLDSRGAWQTAQQVMIAPRSLVQDV